MNKIIVYLISSFSFLNVCARIPIVKLAGINECPYICDQRYKNKGYIIEILENTFQKKGFKLEIKIMPLTRAIRSSKNATIDGVIGIIKKNAPDFIYPTEEQGIKKINFFIAKDNHWTYSGLLSLRKIKLGVLKDYSYGVIDSYIRKYSDTPSIHKISGRGQLERSIKLLIRKRIDVLLQDSSVIKYYSSQLFTINKIKMVEELVKNRIYVAFSPRKRLSKEYAKMISEEMNVLRKSGKLKKIMKKYNLSDWK